MKVATCLQHVPFEGPGVFRQALESRDFVVKTFLVPSEGLPENLGDFLLIMGGPMSVNDSESWIGEEQQFVKIAMSKGIPVLGVCFGSQIMAKASGGSVVPGSTFEIGMVEVTLTDEGKGDHIFSHMPPIFQVFQWHGEGIELSQGMKPLMASADFPVQAFRAQERCYGLLFHPEIEELGIRALCHECPEDVEKGGIPPETIQAQALWHLPMLHQFADRLIDRLVQ